MCELFKKHIFNNLNNEILFEKKIISNTEKERHFITIDLKNRNYFPATRKKFSLKINDDSDLCFIDEKNRLWVRTRRKKIINWRIDLDISISKISQNVYLLKQN
jgi:hypothetical protein